MGDEAQMAKFEAEQRAIKERLGAIDSLIHSSLSGIFKKLDNLVTKDQITEVKQEQKEQEKRLFKAMERPSWATARVFGFLIGVVSVLLSVLLMKIVK